MGLVVGVGGTSCGVQGGATVHVGSGVHVGTGVAVLAGGVVSVPVSVEDHVVGHGAHVNHALVVGLDPVVRRPLPEAPRVLHTRVDQEALDRLVVVAVRAQVQLEALAFGGRRLISGGCDSEQSSKRRTSETSLRSLLPKYSSRPSYKTKCNSVSGS